MDPTLRPGDERLELRRQIDETERLREISERLGTTLEQSFARANAEGGRFDRTLQRMQRSLTGFVTRMAQAPLRSLIRKGVGSLLGGIGQGGAQAFADGGVIAGGRVMPFAQGGVVATPTYFPMRGGTGLMGEAGPEAIMPLARGPDGRLGVAAGGRERPVSVTVNIATPDAASFRRSESQVSATLARAVARGRRAT
ncbi:MAG: phage tail tape measure protein [Salinarimonas sp.]